MDEANKAKCVARAADDQASAIAKQGEKVETEGDGALCAEASTEEMRHGSQEISRTGAPTPLMLRQAHGLTST